MAWPDPYFKRLRTSEKKWLIINISSFYLKKLGFSNEQITSLRHYFGSGFLAKQPLFTVNNPLLAAADMPAQTISRHVNEISLSLWASFYYTQTLSEPDEQEDQTNEPGTRLNLTSLEMKWVATYISTQLLIGVGFNQYQIAYIHSFNSARGNPKKPDCFSETIPNVFPQPIYISEKYDPTKPLSLSNGQKKWMALNLSTDHLSSLHFSSHHIDYILSYMAEDCDPIPPAFQTSIPTNLVQPVVLIEDLELFGFPSPITSISNSTTHTPTNFNSTFITQINPDNPEGTNFNSPFITQINPDNPEDTNPNIDDPNSSHELSVKYSDCYGIRGDGVVKLVEFGGSSGDVSFKVVKESGDYGPTKDCVFSDKFNMSLPKLGLINFDNHVVLVGRSHKKSSPARYRKGLRADTLSFNNISLKEIKALNQKDLLNNAYENEDKERLLRIMAYSIFFPKTFTYEEALESVLTFKRLSTAFSSSMAVKLDIITNKVVLQKNNWVIGSFNPKTKSFDMMINTFNDQLKQLSIPFKGVS